MTFHNKNKSRGTIQKYPSPSSVGSALTLLANRHMNVKNMLILARKKKHTFDYNARPAMVIDHLTNHSPSFQYPGLKNNSMPCYK